MNTLKISNLFVAIFILYNLVPTIVYYNFEYLFLICTISIVLIFINYIVYPKTLIPNSPSNNKKIFFEDKSFFKFLLYLSAFLFLIFCLIWIFFFNHPGLTRRGVGFHLFYGNIRFFENVLLFITYTLSILLFSISFQKNKFSLFYLILGIVISTYIFSKTGTRWILLLSFSPLLVIAFLIYDLKKILLGSIFLFIFSLFFILTRNNFDLNHFFQNLSPAYIGNFIWWDITSIPSLDLINTYQIKLEIININDLKVFLMKVINSIYPGSFFSNVTDSIYIEKYNIHKLREIYGDAAVNRFSSGQSNFQFGINLFPYVYGGILPMFVFIIFLNHLIFIFTTKYIKNNSYLNLALLSSFFSGSLLQIRNPEITYMIPFFMILSIYLLKNFSLKDND